MLTEKLKYLLSSIIISGGLAVMGNTISIYIPNIKIM